MKLISVGTESQPEPEHGTVLGRKVQGVKEGEPGPVKIKGRAEGVLHAPEDFI